MKAILIVTLGILSGIGIKTIQDAPGSTRTERTDIYSPQTQIALEAKPKSFLPYEAGAGGSQSPPRFCLDRLLDAIEHVESGGDSRAVGDNGDAVGAYQLHEVFVRDANRIAGTRYTYSDRWCPVKSRAMTRIVLEHYGKGMPEDKLAVIHISPSKRMDWDRDAAREYLRKINKHL